MQEVSVFGFSAFLGSGNSTGKTVWYVNFVNPVLALDLRSLREYIMFLEYVEYYVQELNV